MEIGGYPVQEERGLLGRRRKRQPSGQSRITWLHRSALISRSGQCERRRRAVGDFGRGEDEVLPHWDARASSWLERQGHVRVDWTQYVFDHVLHDVHL
jgi:hypothetical protein